MGIHKLINRLVAGCLIWVVGFMGKLVNRLVACSGPF